MIAKHYRELRTYQNAKSLALRVFEITKRFPADERFSMIDQIRRSSRSVCANIAEAWRKRRYRAAFIAKLSDAEAEAAETQVWLELALDCKYLTQAEMVFMDDLYDVVAGQIVKMIDDADSWLIKT